MRYFILMTFAAAAMLCHGTPPAAAEPMKCSGENQACASACKKYVDQAPWRTCMTACNQRQSVCMRTGCWDNTCGLLRK